MTTNTGGQAFPQHTLEPNPNGGEPRIIWQEGMTLRDYFAAKALPLMMHADIGRWEGNYQRHAEQAYKYADAMIAARES